MFYDFCSGFCGFLLFFFIRLRKSGIENVPKNGPVILAVNHKSNLDPVVAAITCPRHLNFMAKSELFTNKIFGSLISKLGAFPVHRGKGDIGAIKTAFKIFKQDGVMLIFPEGGRVRNNEKRKAKPGVAMIAQKAGVPVIPVLIDGDYKFMHKVTVRYGKPIIFDKDKKCSGEEIQQMADNVLEEIYKCR